MERIRQLFREIEQEISSERFIRLYQEIREKYSHIEPFLTPKDLIARLHDKDNPDYLLNDAILSSLISEYQAQPSPQLIGAYLLLLFKPGLLKLFSQVRNWLKQFPSLSDLDLWLQITTSFFEVLGQFDMTRDTSKIASRVLGRVRNYIRVYFRESFRALNAESTLESDFYSAPSDIDLAEISAVLDQLVNSGVISETEKHIILATKVYGRSMKELSKELKGISYENIRYKKVKAQKAIFAYLRKKIF